MIRRNNSINCTVAIPITHDTAGILPALKTCVSCRVSEVIICDIANSLSDDPKQLTWYESDKDIFTQTKKLEGKIFKTTDVPKTIRSLHGIIWTLNGDCHVGVRAAQCMVRRIMDGSLQSAYKPVTYVRNWNWKCIFLFFYFMIEWWHLWKHSYRVESVGDECKMRVNNGLDPSGDDDDNSEDGSRNRSRRREQSTSRYWGAFWQASTHRNTTFLVNSEVYIECRDPWMKFRRLVYDDYSSSAAGILHWVRIFLYFFIFMFAPAKVVLFNWNTSSITSLRILSAVWLANSIHIYTLITRYFRGLPSIAIVVFHPFLGLLFLVVYAWTYFFGTDPYSDGNDIMYNSGGGTTLSNRRKIPRQRVTVTSETEEAVATDTDASE